VRERPGHGDRVWIGAHTTIIGPLRIAEQATIGAGSVVVNDVPAGCLATGRPLRVVRRDYDNSAFL
jgi:serine acetyltransferase